MKPNYDQKERELIRELKTWGVDYQTIAKVLMHKKMHEKTLTLNNPIESYADRD